MYRKPLKIKETNKIKLDHLWRVDISNPKFGQDGNWVWIFGQNVDSCLYILKRNGR